MAKHTLSYEQLQQKVALLEQQLSDKNRLKLRSQILANVRDSILVTDIEGEIVYVNEPATQLYGMARNALIGTNIQQLNPTFNLNHFLNFFDENKHLYENWEWTYVHPETQELIWVSGQMNPVHDEKGHVIGVIDVSKDNTEIKRRESELLKRHHQLSSLIDSQSNFLVRTNTQGCHTFANKTFLETFGLSWKQAAGEPHALSAVREDQRKLQETLQKCLLDPGKIFQISIRNCLPEGTLIWTEWEFMGILNQEGDVTEIQGVGKNITERKKAELALKASERKYKTLFESNPQMLLIYSAENQQVLHANHAARHKFQRKSSKLMGIPLTELLASEQHARFLKEFGTIGKKKHSLTEWQFTDKSGRPFYASLAAAPIEYEGIQAVLLMLEDISLRVEAQKQLKQVSNRLFIATKTDTIGVWDYDHTDQTVVWDSSMYTMYHETAEESKDLWAIMFQKVHPEDLAKVQLLFQRAFEEPTMHEFEVEYRIAPKEGTIVHVRMHAEVMRENEEVQRVVGVNLNITELKEIENDLRTHLEELKKTNAELDHFVYSTSHNLRSPLSSILGLVGILKEQPTQPELLEHIEQSVHKLDATIHEITNYSRNARMEVSREKIDFEKMLAAILENLGYLPHSDRVVVRLQNCVKEPIYTDASRLHMILQNLISNSLKFASAYREHCFVEVTIHAENSGLSITVMDNGMGIAPEHQPHIFEMFYRATNRSYGSGLGLYVAREAAERLGGTLQLTESSQEQTIFTLQIPLT